MDKITPARSGVSVVVTFESPFFDWHGVTARFFEMVHSALSSKISIEPSNFSVANGNSLGDVMARFNVFGGTSSITISAEKLSLDFPNLLPGESDLAYEIIRSVESGFLKEFRECRYSTIRHMSYKHVELYQDGPISMYLQRYAIPSVSELCNNTDIVHMPTGRFTLTDSNATWRALCSIERSEVLENGLFLYSEVALMGVNMNETFDAHLERILNIVSICESAFELEWEL
ncbi:MAG: hypothetical protein OXJ38_05360 [Gammaproteobacteria bacterium]|nr:hypothetical protein [Gammaproteobacteria bacterium]